MWLAKLAMLKQVASHIPFCVDAHVRETTKTLIRCCLSLRTYRLRIARNLDRQQIIIIAESLFLELSAFFYSKVQVVRACKGVPVRYKKELTQILILQQFLILIVKFYLLCVGGK